MEETVRGIQDAGVQSVSKHFIANEQETQRSNTFLPNGTEIEGISANVDDRTMHELYLWPFADAVKAGTVSVMCAYNRINQTYACQNDKLLNGLLKEELGFPGYVSSDYFAVHAGVASAKGGLDANMPGGIDLATISTGTSYYGGNITMAVNNGSLPIARLDDMVRRVMTSYYILGQDKDFPSIDPANSAFLSTIYNPTYRGPQPVARDVRRDHAKVIRKLGSAGSVLLKNIGAALPIDPAKIKNIGVFGGDAADLVSGLSWPGESSIAGQEIGTLDIGGGSGAGKHVSIGKCLYCLSWCSCNLSTHTNAPLIVSPLEAIKNRALRTGARVQYITNNRVLAANDLSSIYPTPDVCFVFLNTYASEGHDRTEWEADGNSTLVVNNVANKCNNTVVVTHSAGINTMPWADHPNVKAIIAAHLPGEQTGNSIVDVLWGDYNPAGKLPYTIPRNGSDYDLPVVNLTSVSTPTGWQADFTEGQMIDYRHFDSKNIVPRYEFGFGLSYTNFTLTEDLEIKQLVKQVAATANPGATIRPGGNPELWVELLRVSTKLKNTGKIAGATVPQLYLTMPSSVPAGTPVRALRGFQKIYLKAGEERKVEFLLTRRDLSYWDVVSQAWVLPTGSFNVQVGFSSRDLPMKGSVQIR